MLGQSEVVLARVGTKIQILVQGHQTRANSQRTAWVSPERVSELGPISELRFAVFVKSDLLKPGLLLERLRLR